MEIDVIEILNIQDTIQQLNSYFNLPKQDGLTVFDENSFFEYEGKHYMMYDEKYASILGEPITIIIENEPLNF